MGYNMRRRWPLPIAAAVLCLSAATAAVAVPIPSLPGPMLVPTYVGAPAVAHPIASFPVPQHPHLAPNGVNNIHNDAYATDAYTGAGPLGRKPAVTSRFYGVQECATAAFDRHGRIVGLCPSALAPYLMLIDPVTLAPTAKYQLPPRDLASGRNPLTDFCGGAYFYLDDQDRAVVDTTARTIQVVADTGTKFVLQHTYDLTSVVPAADCLIALMPDWSGRIWFVTSKGIVGDVDPATSAVRAVSLPGEIIDNSFAVDETGGVFIVSDHALYRFDADPATGGPVVAAAVC